MKTVNYREYKQELARCNEQLRLVKLIDLDDEQVQIGINWPAIGAVPTEQAQEFAAELNEACEMAEDFKYNGCSITY